MPTAVGRWAGLYRSKKSGPFFGGCARTNGPLFLDLYRQACERGSQVRRTTKKTKYFWCPAWLRNRSFVSRPVSTSAGQAQTSRWKWDGSLKSEHSCRLRNFFPVAAPTHACVNDLGVRHARRQRRNKHVTLCISLWRTGTKSDPFTTNVVLRM